MKDGVLGDINSVSFLRWMEAKPMRNSAVISFHSHWQMSVKSGELKRQAWWQRFNSTAKQMRQKYAPGLKRPEIWKAESRDQSIQRKEHLGTALLPEEKSKKAKCRRTLLS